MDKKRPDADPSSIYRRFSIEMQPEPQTALITLFLNQELIVKDVFIDVDPEPLSMKIKNLIR